MLDERNVIRPCTVELLASATELRIMALTDDWGASRGC